MDSNQFWALIEDARRQVPDPTDAAAVAERATALLATHPRADIVATQQILWDLMADSYRTPLWAAAYTINGGCSDDGFDYFRGWLITQGRTAHEQAAADPDTLADLPAVRAAAAGDFELECEAALGIAWYAHLTAAGEQLPAGACTIRYPALETGWDFEDPAELPRRLPRLAELYQL
jgi:hypothetical protein